MADRRTQASVGTDEARALEPEGAASAGVALASLHVRVVDADVPLPRWVQVKSGRAYEKALQQCDEMLKAFQVCVPWSPTLPQSDVDSVSNAPASCTNRTIMLSPTACRHMLHATCTVACSNSKWSCCMLFRTCRFLMCPIAAGRATQAALVC
jgi:hypothetical protein